MPFDSINRTSGRSICRKAVTSAGLIVESFGGDVVSTIFILFLKLIAIYFILFHYLMPTFCGKNLR